MKIESIKINDYAHFKNLDFDFRYKTGINAGKPLNKICLIGQSGTGKTTLLNLIETSLRALQKAYTFNSSAQLKQNQVNQKLDSSANILIDGFSFDFLINNKIKYLDTNLFETRRSKIDKLDLLLLYISAEIISEKNSILDKDNTIVNTKNVITSQGETSKILNELKNIQANIKSEKVFKLSNELNQNIWLYIVNNILQYDEKLKQKGADIIHRGYHANPQKITQELEKWRQENPNPRENIATNCLNPILEKFNLEVASDEISSPIVIKERNGSILSSNLLSTGTKQFILGSLAIYQLSKPGTIVLLDEPERSLFPDIQMELIFHFMKMLPDNQLIVATHSPIIAAAFHPEERFLFSFDANCKIRIERGKAPIGDDPNDLLRKDFNIQSLMNQVGRDKYKEYLELKTRISNETNDEEKNKLIINATKLATEYNFDK